MNGDLSHMSLFLFVKQIVRVIRFANRLKLHYQSGCPLRDLEIPVERHTHVDMEQLQSLEALEKCNPLRRHWAFANEGQSNRESFCAAASTLRI